MPSVKYEEIPGRASSEPELYAIDDIEARSLLPGGQTPRQTRRSWNWNTTLTILNTILSLTLLLSLASIHLSDTTPGHSQELDDPYSPALEAVVPVIKKFSPNMIYQSEPSPEVEKAWHDILGPYQGVIALSAQDSARLKETSHESIESYIEPGKHLYAPSVYHQLHCLNILRKSLYREKFFPEIDDEHYNFHKNHCIDFLRQAIMCHGDVSMTYWWNDTYSSVNEQGVKVYSKQFLDWDANERSIHSIVHWDIEHKCRAWEPIHEWVNQHPVWPKGSQTEGVPPPEIT